jgi:UDP-N-acetylglucosamine 2-epimerase (non-hydrolysing)
MLAGLLATLTEVSADVPVLLPLHPRTRQRIGEFGLAERVAFVGGSAARLPSRGLIGLEPLSYLEMLQALAAARFVLTDSGGIQEETTALGVPCVTLRENTERPITISAGTNVLAGTERREILAALEVARKKVARKPCMPELWDGQAGGRIVSVLANMVDRS